MAKTELQYDFLEFMFVELSLTSLKLSHTLGAKCTPQET